MKTGCRLAALCVVLQLVACGGKQEGQESSGLDKAKAVVGQVVSAAGIARELASAGRDEPIDEMLADLPSCKPVDGVGGDCPQGAARLLCINEVLMADASPEIRQHMHDTFLELYRSLPQAQRTQMIEQGEVALAQEGKGCARS